MLLRLFFLFFPIYSLISYELCESLPKRYVYCKSNTGRLGDHLITYVKAKWFAKKHDLPLLLEPSKYYQELKIVEKEIFCIKTCLSGLEKPIFDIYQDNFSEKNCFLIQRRPTLFYLGYQQDLLEDFAFRKEISQLIAPIQKLNLIYPPKDRISVAIHIRTGRGFDKPLLSEQLFNIDEMQVIYLSRGHRLLQNRRKKYHDVAKWGKFIPEQFFIDALKKISDIFSHQPIYVFLFTDDLFPKELCERIQKQVGLPNIIYDCRKDAVENTVLEDFFSIKNFDCLIRPFSSHFSYVAELLSQHKIVLYPKKIFWAWDQKDKFFLITQEIGVNSDKSIYPF